MIADSTCEKEKVFLVPEVLAQLRAAAAADLRGAIVDRGELADAAGDAEARSKTVDERGIQQRRERRQRVRVARIVEYGGTRRQPTRRGRADGGVLERKGGEGSRERCEAGAECNVRGIGIVGVEGGV